MKFLEHLKSNNEFPIIFIGSGITRRYFKDAPTWDNLLQKLWEESNIDSSYLARFNELEKDKNTSFDIYTNLAEEIEKKFDSEFYNGKITLKNLSPEQAHKGKISPFRCRIAEIYSNLQLKDGIEEELALFQQMLQKARLIVTTNYDGFIEKQFDNRIKVRIGNKGLFENTADINELYKIHGSIDDPNSIVITTSDYEKLKRTSAIVNAKILSKLTESPILFLGYSLTDENIRCLLKDLADNMPFSIEDAARRIGVVDYKKGQSKVSEVICDTFGVHYTQLSTDNYSEIYEKVAEIDQGVSPSEIAKYQAAFRKIIDIKGKKGELKNVLTSFVNLDKLPDELKKRNLVVAFGDNRYLYKYPSYADYVKSYFLEEDDMPLEIAIKFITNLSPQSALPISKYLLKLKNNGGITLTERDKNKINNRLRRFESLSSLNVSEPGNKYIDRLKKLDFTQPEKIFEDNDLMHRLKIMYFIKHINNYSQEVIMNMIKYILINEDDNFIGETNCRKLFLAYSLKFEEKFDEI